MGFRYSFSLIELMVVIAIVALLSAFGAPAYKTYVIKTKVSVAFNSVVDIADRIIIYWDSHDVSTQYLSAISQALNLPADEPNHWIFQPPYTDSGDLSDSMNLYRLYYQGSPSTNPQYFLLSATVTNTGDSSIDNIEGFAYSCRIVDEIWECACAPRYGSGNVGVDASLLPSKCSDRGEILTASGWPNS